MPAFLKIGSIKGESKDQDHRDWIEIQSYSWGVEQTRSTSDTAGGGSGLPSIQDLVLTKRLDKSSPLLFDACARGTHIPEATIRLIRSRNDRQPFLEYTLSDVIISSYQPSGSAQDVDYPTEQASLNFTKIKMDYREIDPSSNKVVEVVEASYSSRGR